MPDRSSCLFRRARRTETVAEVVAGGEDSRGSAHRSRCGDLTGNRELDRARRDRAALGHMVEERLV